MFLHSAIAVPHIVDAFDDLTLAALSFEINEAQEAWYTDIITETSPEEPAIQARLALVSGLCNVATPHYEVSLLLPKDWLSEVEKSFPPLHIGRFYVHGSHVKSAPPRNKIILKINAGMAFGSGEHDTTSGCLLALSALDKTPLFLKAARYGMRLGNPGAGDSEIVAH